MAHGDLQVQRAVSSAAVKLSLANILGKDNPLIPDTWLENISVYIHCTPNIITGFTSIAMATISPFLKHNSTLFYMVYCSKFLRWSWKAQVWRRSRLVWLLQEEMCHSVALSVFCAIRHVKWKTGGLSLNDPILVLFLPKLFLSFPVIQHYAFWTLCKHF